MKQVLAQLVAGDDLSAEVMERAVGLIMDGEATPAQVGAFLVALRLKGETRSELVAAARAMRARAVPLDVEGPLLDTCGTGGDGLGTFNVSTATAFVAAAGGARVAKHGNRAASGKVGAADVLEALGASIDVSPEVSARSLEEIGFAFLFAPSYHPAVRHVAGPRRELGVRTLFNLTGPLCNPAHATHQLLGIYSGELLHGVAEALAELGSERAMVVHGSDGSDEITTTGPTAVVELKGGHIEGYTIDPSALGLATARIDDLAGGSAEENAATLKDILSGGEGALADITALNAGAALYVADKAEDIAGGLALARRIMKSGDARDLVEKWVALTRGAGE